DTVAKVPGVRADQVRVVHALPVCVEIGSGRGIIEAAQRTAKLRTTARGGKASALSEEIRFGNTRRSAARENLNDAGHCVCSVQRAFSAVHDLDLLHVVQRE